MKKYTVLLVLVLCLVISQFALAAPKFGIGGNLAMPQGDWSDAVSSIGFGGTAQALFVMGENMAVGVQAGYIIFGGETVDLGLAGEYEYDYSAIPILGVFRYYLGVPGGPRPFVGGLVGFHLFQASAKITTTLPFVGTTTIEEDLNSTEFSFAPAAGIEVGAIEIMAFYMIVSDANYIGARIGFNFGGVE
jgi:hypothetical protein